MAQQLTLLYGIDPQKPYTLSFAYLNDFPFSPGDSSMLSGAAAQAGVEAIASGGGVAIANVNEFVSYLGYAIAGTQGAVVQHFSWTLRDTNNSLDPDDLELVWSAAAPNYVPVANAALQNDMPNAVAGLKMRSVVGGRNRLFAWGLLSQPAEDANANAILTPGSGNATADYFYVVRELVSLCAPAVISGRFVEKTFVGVIAQQALYKGVRRA